MEDSKTYYTRKLNEAKAVYVQALKDLASKVKQSYNMVEATIESNESQKEEKPAWFVRYIDITMEMNAVREAETEVKKYQEVVDALRWQVSESHDE